MLATPLSSLCISCLRQRARPGIGLVASPFWSQVRGKKRLPRSQTILVKLLQDIPGYGRKDAIIPVAPGRMRNIWFPHGRAEYVTHAQRKLVKDSVQQRDSTFLLRNEEESESGALIAAQDEPDPTLDVLSPQQSQQIIEDLVPAYLDFHRKPISAKETKQEELPDDPQDLGEQAILEGYDSAMTKTKADTTSEVPASDEAMPAEATPTAIFGSVSTTDIATSLRALLSLKAEEEGVEDAARVTLAAEDIDIIPIEGLPAAVEGPRIKASGEYNIAIRIKGESAVRRTVRVHLEDSS